MSENLPGFAQPVFVRIQTDITTTGTFKLVKGDLRKQSFHIEQVGNDTIYVMMPRTNSYQILDQAFIWLDHGWICRLLRNIGLNVKEQ